MSASYFICRVVLGKSFKLSEPPNCLLENEAKGVIAHGLVVRINKISRQIN